jgi:hypothetical protein
MRGGKYFGEYGCSALAAALILLLYRQKQSLQLAKKGRLNFAAKEY